MKLIDFIFSSFWHFFGFWLLLEATLRFILRLMRLHGQRKATPQRDTNPFQGVNSFLNESQFDRVVVRSKKVVKAFELQQMSFDETYITRQILREMTNGLGDLVAHTRCELPNGDIEFEAHIVVLKK